LDRSPDTSLILPFALLASQRHDDQARGLAMKRLIFPALVMTVCWSSNAAKAQNLDGLKACARISDESARLACYDSAVAALDAALAAEIATRQQEMQTRQAEEQRLAEAQAAQSKVDSFGASQLPPERQPKVKAEPFDQLGAKIDVASYDAYGNLAALLDNGQTWVQTESLTLPRIKPGDDVEIKRGALGSFRMKLLRSGRFFSVKRRR
jgi:multidrug efflux pump subunit AcrA (membrane-fusion protein)